MAREALLFVGIVGVVLSATEPGACARMLDRSSAAPVPEPPPPPPTSATAPPVWAPAETGAPPAPAASVNPELAKGRSLAQAGDHKKVRALLEKKVRAGKGNREEAAILMDACMNLRDRPCMDAVKGKHPEVDGP
jgi:hypothetical protein